MKMANFEHLCYLYFIEIYTEVPRLYIKVYSGLYKLEEVDTCVWVVEFITSDKCKDENKMLLTTN
jgi:hypothetical protein